MRRLFHLLILTAATAALPATAAEVARWVDENGVTHFGERQFAPVEHTEVDIAPANGMAPAQYSDSSSGRGPTFIRLERQHMENKRGFRGHYSRQNRSEGRRRQR